MSLDGFISSVDGGVEWLEPFESEGSDYDAFIADIDSIVMGRTTYEQVRTFGNWPYEGKPTIVMSSQQLKGLPDNTRVLNCDTRIVANDFNSGNIWVLGVRARFAAFSTKVSWIVSSCW